MCRVCHWNEWTNKPCTAIWHTSVNLSCVWDVRWKGIGTNVIFDLATGQTWPPRHVNVFIRFSKCFVGATHDTCRTSSSLSPKRRDSDYELFAYKCNTVSVLRSHAQWLSTNDYCICVCDCNMQHSSSIDSNWKSPQHIRKWMKCAISNRYNVVVRVHKAQTHAPTTPGTISCNYVWRLDKFVTMTDWFESSTCGHVTCGSRYASVYTHWMHVHHSEDTHISQFYVRNFRHKSRDDRIINQITVRSLQENVKRLP